jgi:ribosome-binding protein aMBF1 (putative translation factor)
MKKVNEKLVYVPDRFFRELMKNQEVRFLAGKQDEQFRLATAIRKARERAGLSQSALARKIGTKQSAISRVESGVYKSVPSLVFLQKVAVACGAKLEISFDFKKAV